VRVVENNKGIKRALLSEIRRAEPPKIEAGRADIARVRFFSPPTGNNRDTLAGPPLNDFPVF